MAQISKSVAALRIIGENLVPEEVTARLGCEPSLSYKKGDIRVGRHTKREYTHNNGMWNLRATDKTPEDLNSQINEILEKITKNPEAWEDLGNRYYIDLFIGLFMNESNEGIDVSPHSMLALSERGISLALDIYSPDED